MSLDGPRIVFEGAGTVNICVIIQNDEEGRPCSRDRDFNITFFTAFDSAGEIHYDFTPHKPYIVATRTHSSALRPGCIKIMQNFRFLFVLRV